MEVGGCVCFQFVFLGQFFSWKIFLDLIKDFLGSKKKVSEKFFVFFRYYKIYKMGIVQIFALAQPKSALRAWIDSYE